MTTSVDSPHIQSLEMDLLLEAVLKARGYDFRNYARASLERRIHTTRIKLDLETVSDLIPKLIHHDPSFAIFLGEMSVTVTEMFRNPSFFKTLREEIIPSLRAWPYLKIWCAGCATGEEAYSLAILLKEEDLFHRCQIYATDFNTRSLATAREGSFPLDKMKSYVENYHNSGGKKDFTDYYRAGNQSVLLDGELRENILFTQHNLVCDGSFGELNLILCRNVLIYFNQTLQNRVFDLFDQSLCHGGFLCLGSKESLNFSGLEKRYAPVNAEEKIFKKGYTTDS